MTEEEARQLPEWRTYEAQQKSVDEAQKVLDKQKKLLEADRDALIEKVCKFKVGQALIWTESLSNGKRILKHRGVVVERHLTGRWDNKKYNPSYSLKKQKKDGSTSLVNLRFGWGIPETELEAVENG